MSYKVGIVGKTGQLARALISICAQKRVEVIALDRTELDLSGGDDEILAALGAFEGVNGIINAAAYTAVDQAESDEETAYRVNAVAPGLIAEYCHNKEIPLVHISTDYVFDGQSKTPYQPEEATAPLGAYGRTKLQGEDFIRSSNVSHAILRTSWVYDGQGKNFMTTMLRLAQSREVLTVVEDQFGRPTYAHHLAEACLRSLETLLEDPGVSGTYHVSNAGSIVSWAAFARAIFELANPYLGHEIKVMGIPSSDYPTPADRPAYSAMDISKFQTVFDYELPDWTAGLEGALAQWVTEKGL